ncbi:hypothetical protein NE865_11149 [Phthorimaea operculella]|nr:hypothetical protein NE865_11149 [Phthorimaea operculella]
MGEFDLSVERFEPCRGPKRSCSVVKAKIIDASKVSYDMVVTQNMRLTKSKITASANGKQLLRLQTKNPCDHLFFKPLLQSMINVTGNCDVHKGHYNFYVDVGEIARTYYHGAFIYGKITFKSVFFNNECNLSCTVVKVTLSPKNMSHNQ